MMSMAALPLRWVEGRDESRIIAVMKVGVLVGRSSYLSGDG